jgi:hypothetical protein
MPKKSAIAELAELRAELEKKSKEIEELKKYANIRKPRFPSPKDRHARQILSKVFGVRKAIYKVIEECEVLKEKGKMTEEEIAYSTERDLKFWTVIQSGMELIYTNDDIIAGHEEAAKNEKKAKALNEAKEAKRSSAMTSPPSEPEERVPVLVDS